LSKFDGVDKDTLSSDDNTSMEDSSGDEIEGNKTTLPKKRRIVEDSQESSAKRARRLWQSAKPSDAQEENGVVDTSILKNPSPSPTSVFDAHKSLVKPDADAEDDSSATNKKNERLEMIEQSMIVSEVAMKLEEYARKAMKGRGSSRTRRGVAGVVTPPWGSSQHTTISSRGLITYDDEYENDGKNNSSVISDGDDSLNSEDNPFSGAESKPTKQAREFLLPPVPDFEAVKQISSEIRRRASYNFYNAEVIHACANVAEFFMSTPPGEHIDACCKKVIQLIASSTKLAADFHFYRAALHPEKAGDSLPSFPARFEQHHHAALRRTFEVGASRSDALREFKIFAVNLIYKLLGRNGSLHIQEPLSKLHYANLLHTAEVWSKSVGSFA
jgi:hypothetical protein